MRVTYKYCYRGSKYGSKYGISFFKLEKKFKILIKKNKFIKKHHLDDRFMQLIFNIEHRHKNSHGYRKIFYHKKEKRVTTRKGYIESIKFRDWECAYCKAKISSKIDVYKKENFVCKNCLEYYKTAKKDKKISSVVVDSMNAFVAKFKAELANEQKVMIAYIKKNKQIIKNYEESGTLF